MPLFHLIYCVAIFVGWFLTHSSFRSAWWIQFLNLFVPLYFLPLPLLLALSWFNQDGTGWLFLMIPLLIFAYEYRASLVAKPKHSPPSNGNRLRVMTWNTYYRNADVEATWAVIQRQRPDLLALQELGIPLSKGLAVKLAADYPYHALFPSDSPWGCGIFSRYPITHASSPTQEGQYWSQQVTVWFGDEKMTLISAHPRIADIRLRYFAGIPLPVGFETEPQDVQLRCLLHQIDQVQGPLLVVGDFNLSDRQPMYREFARRLTDAQRVAGRGLGFSFPTNLTVLAFFKVPLPPLPMLPFLRLDYVFYNECWQALQARSDRASVSDHRYLVVDLQRAECRRQDRAIANFVKTSDKSDF